MFRTLDDFRACWTEEAKITQRVLEAVPDHASGHAVAEGHRDLRRLAWHLVESVVEMPGHMGLGIEGKHLIEGGFIVEPPGSMTEIREAYATAAASLLRGLEAWSDGDLQAEDELYGERWKRGFTLQVLVMHQTHHRGQMTVLLRQAGLKVPEVYGPAKEGWAAYGMEPPRV